MIKNAEEFVRLRTSEDVAEQDMATWEKASVEVWLDIIKKYPEMREWVAHNKKVQQEILLILADDPDWRVRSTVARKGSAGEEILWKLSKDNDESVRLGVACNRKASREILESLIDDDAEEVSEFAMKKLRERYS